MCYTPILLKNKTDKLVYVPCGKCVKCKKRRASTWSLRLINQDKSSNNSLFLTLTYDTDHVHITPKGFMTLCPPTYTLSKSGKSRTRTDDMTLFMKRLRKRFPNRKMKYYYCGEYGEKSDRPHYHMILFNAPAVNDNVFAELWQKGQVHIGSVTEASVGYTLKYISKDGKVPKHKNDDRIPEYSRMSKGLGLPYLTENTINWHKDDLLNRCHAVTKQGHKIALPRYLKDRIYNEDERRKIANHFDKERNLMYGTKPEIYNSEEYANFVKSITQIKNSSNFKISKHETSNEIINHKRNTVETLRD